MAVKLINRIFNSLAELFIKDGNLRVERDLRVEENALAKVNNVSGVYLGCPIGTVVMWTGGTAPDEWLICNGDTISSNMQGKTLTTEEQDRLNNILAGAYGTNKLPDLRQRFPLGADTRTSTTFKQQTTDNLGVPEYYTVTTGSTGGDSGHVLIKEEIPKHSHAIKYGVSSGTVSGHIEANGAYGDIVTSSSSRTTNTENDGGGSNWGTFKHSNVPPFLAINFIIKYK